MNSKSTTRTKQVTARHVRDEFDRAAPCDIEAEKQLLGSILRKPEMFGDVNPPPGWFSDFRFFRVALAMRSLHRDNLVPDVPAVTARLKRCNGDIRSDFDRIGGAATLAEILRSVATAAHAKSYARRLRDFDIRRRLREEYFGAIANIHAAESADILLRESQERLSEVRELTRHGGHDDLVSVTASDVEAVNVSWHSKPWLPKGALSLCDGDPGAGKTTMAIDKTARLTTGRPMPPFDGDVGTYDPVNALFISGEDNIATTIVPRLVAAGADLRRVKILKGKQAGDVVHALTIPEDCDAIERAIVDHQALFAVLDPVTAYLSETVNANRDADVRRALHPLAMMAERTGAAILMIRHLNKNQHQSAMYRGGGSIAFIAAARAAWIVGSDPDDQDVFVLAMNKLNIARHPRALRYQIESVGGTSRIRWLGVCDLGKEQILPRPGGKRVSKSDQCAELLRDLLADGPRDSEEINTICDNRGFGRKAFNAGKRKAGVIAEKTGFQGRWQLRLPDDSKGAPEGDSLGDSGPEGDSLEQEQF